MSDVEKDEIVFGVEISFWSGYKNKDGFVWAYRPGAGTTPIFIEGVPDYILNNIPPIGKNIPRCSYSLPTPKKTFHNHNIDVTGIKRECAVCKRNDSLDLHHIDHNSKNNKQSNLIFLCQTHHYLHHRKKITIDELITREKQGDLNATNNGKV